MTNEYGEMDFELEENEDSTIQDYEFKNLYYVDEVDFGRAVFLINMTEKLVIEANFVDLILQNLIERGGLYDDKTVAFFIKEATEMQDEKYEDLVAELKSNAKETRPIKGD